MRAEITVPRKTSTMRLELSCCTKTLLNEVNNLDLRQKDVALTYAMAICSSETTDWKTINEAIIKRWSRSGLERIKNAAWKLIEHKGRRLRMP